MIDVQKEQQKQIGKLTDVVLAQGKMIRKLGDKLISGHSFPSTKNDKGFIY